MRPVCINIVIVWCKKRSQITQRRKINRKIELDRLSGVPRRISTGIEVAETMLSHFQHPYVANPLLNITIDRMIKEEGRESVADILNTLSHLISKGCNPNETGPINLGNAEK